MITRNRCQTSSGRVCELFFESRNPWRSSREGVVLGLLLASAVVFADSPSSPRPIGGRWYVQAGERPVYLYRDADRFVEVFARKHDDSNKDGIADLRLSHDERFLIARTQNYPNHPTALFPNNKNPNTIETQDFTFRLPLVPKLARTVTSLPMGPIGMAVNGVVFFNPFEMGGMNAIEGYSEMWLDSCCGHPQQHGVYHYHKYPSCVKSPFSDDGEQHSPIIGFAWDGFPVYGPYENANVWAKDLKGSRALDKCNGHTDDKRGYHYHVTLERFPYIIGGYAGVVETSNNHHLRHAGNGVITNNASGKSRLGDSIVSVTPQSAQRGKRHTLAIELAPPGRGHEAAPAGVPSWVQVGPFKGSAISRKGRKVLFDIDVPDDATVGVSFDCHVEFGSANSSEGIVVLKRNNVFRVEK